MTAEFKQNQKSQIYTWLPTLLVAVLSTTLVLLVVRLESERLNQEVNNRTLEQLSSLQSSIESPLNSHMQLFQGLVSHISINTLITDAELNLHIAQLMKRQTLLRSIGISRGYTVSTVYPQEGNEAAIGLNYLENPAQRGPILRAIKQQVNVLAGPVQLVQGGTALIGRLPIFTAFDIPGRPEGSFWGIISLVIDMDLLYKSIGLDNDSLPIEVAIRGRDGKGPYGKVFFGDPSLFETSPNKLTIQLPGGSWQLAAKAKPKLVQKVASNTSLVKVFGIIIGVLATLVTWIFSRQFIQQRAIIHFQNSSREQIWHAATHDRLTGMANRHLFNEELNRLVAVSERQKQRMAVFFLDLDRFKEINDSFSHNVGDIFLKEFSLRLKSIVRETELVARLGGDEFAVIATNLSTESATHLAIRISESLNTPIEVDHHALRAGVSVGISIYPDDGKTPDILTHHADLAMYAAKENPLNSFSFFEETMNQAALERKQLVDDIRTGIAEEQFCMAYQPIISVETNECVGMEALARWPHPEKGMISPVRFIPAAEGSGLIIPFGEWALKTSLKDNNAILREHTLAVLSVNLSPIQLYRGNPLEMIQRLLDETGITPKQLDIELTESTILEDVEIATETIRKIRQMGVSVTIDDFGTGYSSLSHLQQLPVSRIKIDSSFVRGIGMDPHSEAIIQAILFLSELLKVRVTAEGVETQEQLDFLKNLGCEEIQGYYFSKPISADELKDKFYSLGKSLV